MGSLTSSRLVFCEPGQDDADAVFRVHGDPRTYAHHPSWVMVDPTQAREVPAFWRAHWQEHGFGYAVLRRRADPESRMGDEIRVGDEGTQGLDPPVRAGEILGFAGLKWQTVLGHRVLNLYYRLAPEAWGQGYATEAAQALVHWAAEHHPDTPVLARVALANPASQHAAESAGLVLIPETDPQDPVPHRILLSRPW